MLQIGEFGGRSSARPQTSIFRPATVPTAAAIRVASASYSLPPPPPPLLANSNGTQLHTSSPRPFRRRTFRLSLDSESEAVNVYEYIKTSQKPIRLLHLYSAFPFYRLKSSRHDDPNKNPLRKSGTRTARSKKKIRMKYVYEVLFFLLLCVLLLSRY